VLPSLLLTAFLKIILLGKVTPFFNNQRALPFFSIHILKIHIQSYTAIKNITSRVYICIYVCIYIHTHTYTHHILNFLDVKEYISMCNFHIQSNIFNIIIITGTVCPYQNTFTQICTFNQRHYVTINVYPWILTV